MNIWLMNVIDFRARLALAPDDDAAGGEPPAGGDASPPPGAGEPAPAGEGGEAKWWEDKRFNDDERRNLTALGLTTEDPLEAVQRLNGMEISAKKRLGVSADQLLQKPKEGQDVADWMRQNGGVFGIPEAPEGYEVKRPDSWPEGAAWNADLETQARKIAHEEGLSGKALSRMIELYAGEVSRLDQSAGEQLAQANQQMMADLERDWGGNLPAKLTQAKQAAAVLAEKAGLSSDAMGGIAQALAPKTGDAGIIKLFAAIGDMMGEDSMDGLGAGRGALELSTTPAEARQKLEQLQSPGGDYYQAVAKKDQTAIKRLRPEIERLTKLATG
ncbi:hypothetical protein [Oceanicola sp. S124]|uniref:hypothetical protein n=1 Tax=Oceanicola sp. S124 TaxID=1042378 RepID=UPI0002558996|nr:hypothetical protein [Oceanicola sp. S124]